MSLHGSLPCAWSRQADSDQEGHDESDEETPLRSLSDGAGIEPNRCGTWLKVAELQNQIEHR